MKKVSKSFQAIVATTIVGILIPKLVEITGVQLFDKLIIKILLSLAFFVATVAVGILYNFGVLKNRREGGKARIVIYLIIVIAIFGSTASILSFIQVVSEIVLYIAIGIAILVTLIFLCVILKLALSSKKDAKQVNRLPHSYEIVVSDEKKQIKLSEENVVEPVVIQYREEYTPVQDVYSEKQKELKTIDELWKEKDPGAKCLTVTNDENPEFLWAKIYKPKYADGKYYGYVKMKHAYETVNGEIYFSNRRIWKLFE